MTSADHVANVGELLLLGGASQRPGADCLDQAAARGLEVCMLDTADNLAALPDLVARANRTVAMDYTDGAACARWAAGQDFAGVYGFRETAVESVAMVANALGLQGNPVDAVRLIRDKYRCREALRQAGFSQPVAALCSGPDDIHDFIEANPHGPWVVKPLNGRGSAGVSVVRDAGQVEVAVRHVRHGQAQLSAELHSQGLDDPEEHDRFLIETFQAGVEYSAEGLFVDGVAQVLAITEKATTGAPHFVETGHALPAALEPDRYRRAAGTVTAALAVLGLRWGVFHVEFWIPPEPGARVVIGELHIRPGGDYIHVMTQLVTGVELHGTVFDQLLGRPVSLPGQPPARAAAVRFLTPSPGRLRSVRGWPEVIADRQFVEGKLSLRAGSTVAPVSSSMDRDSYLIAAAADVSTAKAGASRLADQLSFEYYLQD